MLNSAIQPKHESNLLNEFLNKSENRNRIDFFNRKCIALMPLKKPNRHLFKYIISTFDIETKDGLKGKEFFCCSFSYVDRIEKESLNEINHLDFITETFYKLDDFFNFLKRINERILLKNKKQLIIYVQNLSFEVRFIVDYCKKHEIEFKTLTPNSLTISCNIYELNCRFCDTYQLLHDSQENAETSFNIPEELRKTDMEHLKRIWEKQFKDYTDNDKKLVIEHNINDTKALLYIMMLYRKEIFDDYKLDIAKFYSLSTITLNCFRTTLDEPLKTTFVYSVMNKKKVSYKLDKIAYDFVSEAYFGGRTEVYFNKLLKNIDCFDFNSLYPFEMFDKEFPYGVGIWVSGQNYNQKMILEAIIHSELNLHGVIRIKWKCPENLNIPLLPTRVILSKKENVVRTIYAKGNGYGNYCIPEVQKAYKLGYEIEPLEGFIYVKSKKIFLKYIEMVYTKKQNSVGAKRQINKYLMNELSGKWAQKVILKSTIEEKYLKNLDSIEEYKEEQIELYEKTKIFFDVIKQNDESYFIKTYQYQMIIKAFTNIILSAYTTCYARLELYQSFELLLQNNLKPYYCDTDSIWSYYLSEKFLGNCKTIGKFKKEHETLEVIFICNKKYVFRDKLDNQIYLTMCGYNDKDKKILLKSFQDKSIEDIVKFLKTNNHIEEKERFLPLKSAIKKGNVLTSRSIKKVYRFDEKKRIFDNEGNSYPHILDEKIEIVKRNCFKNLDKCSD